MTTREYQYGNATIKMYRPELTKQQQIKQERNILIAIQQIGKEMKENEHGNSNTSRNIRKE